jgi:hypothetical protein
MPVGPPQARGFGVLGARGSEFEAEIAFGAARQLFEPMLRAASPGERRRLLDGVARVGAQALSLRRTAPPTRQSWPRRVISTSLRSTRLRLALAVLVIMNAAGAIARCVAPSAASFATRSSPAVSAARPVSAAP